MSELEIIAKMQAGDPAGLEALMERYTRYVSTVVWNILQYSMTPEDGEEVASDVFLAAWKQAYALRPGSVKSWLAAVARNTARNKLRELGKTVPLEEEALEFPDSSALQMERDEEAELVQQAVDSLPLQDRELFLRHYYYLQPIRQISTDTGLNASTIKTRLRRGRMRLKAFLTREGYSYEAKCI